MAQVTADPNRVIVRYQQELAQANHKLIQIGAVADQLSDELDQAKAEIERLKPPEETPTDASQ